MDRQIEMILFVFCVAAIAHPMGLIIIYFEMPTRSVFLYSDLPVNCQNGIWITFAIGIIEGILVFSIWGCVLFYLFLHLSYMYSCGSYLRHIM